MQAAGGGGGGRSSGGNAMGRVQGAGTHLTVMSRSSARPSPTMNNTMSTPRCTEAINANVSYVDGWVMMVVMEESHAMLA